MVAAPLPAATRPPLLQATGLTARQAQPSGQPACQPLHGAPAAGAPEPMGATLLPAAVRAPAPHGAPPQAGRSAGQDHTRRAGRASCDSKNPAQGVTNFALFSANARSVALCLFTEADLAAGRTTHEVPLHPARNRTGDVWHIALPGLDPSLLYGAP